MRNSQPQRTKRKCVNLRIRPCFSYLWAEILISAYYRHSTVKRHSDKPANKSFWFNKCLYYISCLNFNENFLVAYWLILNWPMGLKWSNFGMCNLVSVQDNIAKAKQYLAINKAKKKTRFNLSVAGHILTFSTLLIFTAILTVSPAETCSLQLSKGKIKRCASKYKLILRYYLLFTKLCYWEKKIWVKTLWKSDQATEYATAMMDNSATWDV